MVPPTLDARTLERFHRLQLGPIAPMRWGSAWGSDGPLGVLVTPLDFSEESVQRLLDLLLELDLDYLREHPDTPLLYQSGVRYLYEVPDRAEQWLSVPWLRLNARRPDVLADCKGLSCWRAAELRLRGEDARPTCHSRRIAGRVVVHVRVVRGDGSLEDPSAALGMGRRPTSWSL